MILVDTSVWVAHFRDSDAALAGLLNNGEIACHPFIIGELACGGLRNRRQILELLQALPSLPKAEDDEIGAVPPEHAEPDADQMGGPSDQDADNMPPPAAEGAPAPEGEMPPEGAPEGQEGGDEASEMASHAAELSDEELQSMLEVLMAEVEKRHAGAQGAAPEGAESSRGRF